MPSSEIFRNIFRLINLEQFLTIFMNWTNEMIKSKTGKQIIIDRKAIRGVTEKVWMEIYHISAYLTYIGISIGQVKVEDKSNEITAIPELLEILDVEGCIITIDVIGTQTEIMDNKKGGNFVLPVKMNNKGANRETIDFQKMK